MLRIILVTGVLAAVEFTHPGAARANEGPWCALRNFGSDLGAVRHPLSDLGIEWKPLLESGNTNDFDRRVTVGFPFSGNARGYHPQRVPAGRLRERRLAELGSPLYECVGALVELDRFAAHVDRDRIGDAVEEATERGAHSG